MLRGLHHPGSEETLKVSEDGTSVQGDQGRTGEAIQTAMGGAEEAVDTA